MIQGSKRKIALVTGATSGIGKQTAIGLAKLGFIVVVLSRNLGEGENAVAEIKKAAGNENVDLVVCDLSSLTAVRVAAEEIRRRYPKLDVQVNDAAVFMDKRLVTPEGLEMMLVTNHLGHFLLTNLLLDRLEAGRPARIINMTAPSTVAPDFNDLNGERSFSAVRAFGATKAENLMFTYALARRVKDRGISVNAYFPGVTRTNLMKHSPLLFRLIFGVLLRPFVQSPERSAKGVVDLATSEKFANTTGQLIHDGKIIKAPFKDDIAVQEQLWTQSKSLVGIQPG